MELKVLIKALDAVLEIRGGSDRQIRGISADSQKADRDFLFVAVRGARQDGSRFIDEALRRRATALVVEPHAAGLQFPADTTVIVVADTRRALAQLAACFYGDPSARIRCIGVTGTNGKTTITYLIEAILRQAGYNPAVIGTVNYRFNDQVRQATNTTPGPIELQGMLAEMSGAGVTHAVMEVSSHALDQCRTDRIRFESAIFTNLTQDHLDYHKNFEDYFQAKAKLFCGLDPQASAIINVDDAYGQRLLAQTPGRRIGYGLAPSAQVRAENIRMDVDQTHADICCCEGSRCAVSFGLIGMHNLYNVLAAFAWGQSAGIDTPLIKSALEHFTRVPGRLERVDSPKGFSVFVDYAHTQDALKNVLNTLRAIARARIIVVFGCGGDRDKGKRPLMGEVASRLADFAIITTDNPRSEEPQQIAREIAQGITQDNYCLVLDRQEAIRRALELAREDDIVLIAGKGHEHYQIVKDQIIPFDDREAVRACLRSMN